jgi:hypothetical protein
MTRGNYCSSTYIKVFFFETGLEKKMPVVRTIKSGSRRKPHPSPTDGGESLSLSSRKQPSTSQPPKSITIRGQKLVPSVVFDTFWHFASERKAMDDKRRAGLAEP